MKIRKTIRWALAEHPAYVTISGGIMMVLVALVLQALNISQGESAWELLLLPGAIMLFYGLFAWIWSPKAFEKGFQRNEHIMESPPKTVISLFVCGVVCTYYAVHDMSYLSDKTRLLVPLTGLIAFLILLGATVRARLRHTLQLDSKTTVENRRDLLMRSTALGLPIGLALGFLLINEGRLSQGIFFAACAGLILASSPLLIYSAKQRAHAKRDNSSESV